MRRPMWWKRFKIAQMRIFMGMMALSMGIGMMLVLFIPGWSFIVAAALMILGLWTIYTA